MDDITLMVESEEELKSLLIRVKEESGRGGLKLKIKKKKKTKKMASDPINLWQIEREKVKVVTDFSFIGFKITVEVIPAMKSEDDCFSAGKL